MDTPIPIYPLPYRDDLADPYKDIQIYTKTVFRYAGNTELLGHIQDIYVTHSKHKDIIYLVLYHVEDKIRVYTHFTFVKVYSLDSQNRHEFNQFPFIDRVVDGRNESIDIEDILYCQLLSLIHNVLLSKQSWISYNKLLENYNISMHRRASTPMDKEIP